MAVACVNGAGGPVGCLYRVACADGLAVTWPRNDLLSAVRQALTEAEEALVCVAFVNRRGVNLLEPQLTGLAGRVSAAGRFGGRRRYHRSSPGGGG
jgi:hypothetical protein